MNWLAVLWGTAVSAGLLLAGLLGGAWWVLSIWEPKMYLAGYLNILYLFTVCAGGLAAGHKAGKFPWRHGGIAGGLYALMLSFLGTVLAPTLSLGMSLVKLAAGSLILGSLAGVVGYNMQKAKRRRKGVKSLIVQKF